MKNASKPKLIKNIILQLLLQIIYSIFFNLCTEFRELLKLFMCFFLLILETFNGPSCKVLLKTFQSTNPPTSIDGNFNISKHIN